MSFLSKEFEEDLWEQKKVSNFTICNYCIRPLDLDHQKAESTIIKLNDCLLGF